MVPFATTLEKEEDVIYEDPTSKPSEFEKMNQRFFSDKSSTLPRNKKRKPQEKYDWRYDPQTQNHSTTYLSILETIDHHLGEYAYKLRDKKERHEMAETILQDLVKKHHLAPLLDK